MAWDFGLFSVFDHSLAAFERCHTSYTLASISENTRVLLTQASSFAFFVIRKSSTPQTGYLD
jgi:hypothetical protein